jgi:hypothetical protein
MKQLFSECVTVNNSTSEIFEFLTTPSKFPLIMPAIVEANWADDTLLAVGKAYIEKRKAMGKVVAASVHISKFIPGKCIAYKSTAAGITAEYEYVIEEHDYYRIVIVTAFIEASGLSKILQPLFASTMKKNDSEQMERLKNALTKI